MRSTSCPRFAAASNNTHLTADGPAKARVGQHLAHSRHSTPGVVRLVVAITQCHAAPSVVRLVSLGLELGVRRHRTPGVVRLVIEVGRSSRYGAPGVMGLVPPGDGRGQRAPSVVRLVSLGPALARRPRCGGLGRWRCRQSSKCGWGWACQPGEPLREERPAGQ